MFLFSWSNFTSLLVWLGFYHDGLGSNVDNNNLSFVSGLSSYSALFWQHCDKPLARTTTSNVFLTYTAAEARVSEWVSEWVGFNVLCQHWLGYIGRSCTGCDSELNALLECYPTEISSGPDIPPGHIILTHQTDQSYLYFHNAECQAKEQLLPFFKSLVWPGWSSNPRPSLCEADALPLCHHCGCWGSNPWPSH